MDARDKYLRRRPHKHQSWSVILVVVSSAVVATIATQATVGLDDETSVDSAIDVRNSYMDVPLLPVASPVRTLDESNHTLVIELHGDQQAVVSGIQVGLNNVRESLFHEVNPSIPPSDSRGNTTVVIRTTDGVPVGHVQQVIRQCQDEGFSQFELRPVSE